MALLGSNSFSDFLVSEDLDSFRNTDQLFCRMSHDEGVSDIFLVIKLESQLSGGETGKIQVLKEHFSCCCSLVWLDGTTKCLISCGGSISSISNPMVGYPLTPGVSTHHLSLVGMILFLMDNWFTFAIL